ncbi:MAG: glycosyltransferase family 4 protein, partial [Dictyoglomi bacterium]|nr:glycosyltransferase family 4 protein [Dictyoglomota bacterium]
MRKNLLVISNAYPDKEGKTYGGVFVKERVVHIKDLFGRIVVVSPHSFGKKHMFSYTEDNVYVAFPSFMHFPIESMRKQLGNKFAASTQAVIEHHKFIFDIIHAHTIWPSGYAAMLLSKRYKIPYIVTAHGGDLYRFPFEDNWKMKVTRKVLLNASHIIVVAEFMKDIIL